MGNEALRDNYGIGGSPDLQITAHGSNWYWAVCALMGLSTLAFMAWSFTRARSDRTFHYISAAICLTSCIAYFSMASGLGQTGVVQEFMRDKFPMPTRQVFWVRYIQWFVTAPLLLLQLLLAAGLPRATIISAMFAAVLAVVCGLCGALTRSSYKWGYYTFALFALFYILYILSVARRYARTLGPVPAKTFTMCAALLALLWLLYPVCWGLSEGGNVIHPDSEGVFYGILDILSKPVQCFLLLWGLRRVSHSELGLHIRDYVTDGAPASDKRGLFGRRANHANGNGVHNNGATPVVGGTSAV